METGFFPFHPLSYQQAPEAPSKKLRQSVTSSVTVHSANCIGLWKTRISPNRINPLSLGFATSGIHPQTGPTSTDKSAWHSLTTASPPSNLHAFPNPIHPILPGPKTSPAFICVHPVHLRLNGTVPTVHPLGNRFFARSAGIPSLFFLPSNFAPFRAFRG